MGRPRRELRNVGRVRSSIALAEEESRRKELKDLIDAMVGGDVVAAADAISYDTGASGLSGATVQSAIDEVAKRQQITTVATATHTVAPGDYLHTIVHVTTASGCTVTLPSGLDDYQLITIKLAPGAGRVSVLTPGAQEIDGKTSAALTETGGTITLYEVGGHYFTMEGEAMSARNSVFDELWTASYHAQFAIDPGSGLDLVRRDTVTTAGSGAASAANSEINLSTGTTAGSTVDLRTKERGRYQSGSEAMTGIAWRRPSAPTGDIEARWGYYDDNDGFLFGEDSTGLFVQHRHGGTTEAKVYQSAWNGEDPLDGTGPSGLTLDLTKPALFRVRYVAYGAGPAQMKIYTTDSEGNAVFEVVHRFGGIQGESILSQWKLPVTADVTNGTTTTDFDGFVGGRTFGVYAGEFNPDQRSVPETRSAVSVAANTHEPLISFRKKSTAEAKAVSVTLLDASILSDSDGYLIVTQDATLTGATFNAVSNMGGANTAVESDVAATAISGGTRIAAISVSGGTRSSAAAEVQKLTNDLPEGVIVTLGFEDLSGATATVSAAFSVQEEA